LKENNPGELITCFPCFLLLIAIFQLQSELPKKSVAKYPSWPKQVINPVVTVVTGHLGDHPNQMPGNTKDGITSASMMRLIGPSNL